MCLSLLNDNKFCGKKTGYKAVRHCSKGYKPSIYLTPILPKNKWVEDINTFTLKASNNVDYQSGFHIFTNLKDAVSYYRKDCAESIVVVQFDDVLAYGKQFIIRHRSGFSKLANVVVAKRIKVLKKVK